MKRLWLSLFAIVPLLLSTPASASSETVTNFKSISSLSSDNILHVEETISVDFGGISHHGIYRDIPVIRRDNVDAYYYSFNLISASDSLQKSKNGDFVHLRLGDADTTISGQHTYVLVYTLAPVALAAGDHDRVFLNATGEAWEYPILRAQYELTLPVSPSSKPVCYAGRVGSTEKFCSVSVSNKTITSVTTQVLQPGSGLSVDSSVPANSFNSYLVANKKPPVSFIELLALVALYLLGAITFGLALVGVVIALGDQKRKNNQTVVSQYEAPDGLTPAQIGLLSDNKAALQELSATMLDLAVRGYIRITLVTAKAWWHSAEYRFEKLRDFAGLKDYELGLINLFFFDNQDVVTMSTVTSNMSRSGTAQADIKQIKDRIGNGLKNAGYYTQAPGKGGIGVIANFTFAIVFICVWAGLFFGTTSDIISSPYPFLVAGVVIIALQLFLILKRPKLTEAGLQEWAKVQGFKLYLSVAEKARIDFSDAPAKTPERFNTLLPYAVALGVEKDWAKQFEGIDLSQSSGWYSGDPNALTAAAFAGSFSSGFSGAMSSGFSGSSGSGSSGGGGGGGGGGGW